MRVCDYINVVAAKFSVQHLSYGHGTDNPYDEASFLVYAKLNLDFNTEESATRSVSASEINQIETLVRMRIINRTPVAYLVGRAWFAGREYFCDSRALIPRSPIAELIQNEFAGVLDFAPQQILDLCCGGGCIGIAAAIQYPRAQVDLVDISEDALALSKKNITLHNLGSRVQTSHSNLFMKVSKKFDLILANPPYVSSEECDALPMEYGHEPRLGLVSDDEGLELPMSILKDAERFLTENGVLILEVGHSHLVLSERLKDIPLLWLEFGMGGEGVLAIRRAELVQYKARFV